MKLPLLFSLVCAACALALGCGADSQCADAECSDEHDEDVDDVLDCEAARAPTYENFARRFVSSNCLMCHSDKREGAARMGAPLGLNFDTLDDLRAASDNIYQQVVYKRTMPVTGGVSDAERQRLADWLDCDAP